MKASWRLIDSGRCDAFHNMALDEAVATCVRSGAARPTLRFYGWTRPAVSLGCFQKALDVDAGYCKAKDIPIVRRPTGGRAILHGEELTYSFSVATDREPFNRGLLDSYRRISNALSLAFRKMGIPGLSMLQREKGSVLAGSPLCFQSSSYGEILVGGRKAVGSAQRRWEDGLLQQGAIPYSICEGEMCGVFGERKVAAKGRWMFALKEAIPDLDEAEFKEALALSFETTFGISLVPSPPAPEELALARELEAAKYRREEWNFRL